MSHEQVIEQVQVYSTRLPSLVSLTLQSKQPSYVCVSIKLGFHRSLGHFKANTVEHQSKLGIGI